MRDLFALLLGGAIAARVARRLGRHVNLVPAATCTTRAVLARALPRIASWRTDYCRCEHRTDRAHEVQR